MQKRSEDTNDSNTARRFFLKLDLSDEITGLDINLTKNIRIL